MGGGESAPRLVRDDQKTCIVLCSAPQGKNKSGRLLFMSASYSRPVALHTWRNYILEIRRFFSVAHGTLRSADDLRVDDLVQAWQLQAMRGPLHSVRSLRNLTLGLVEDIVANMLWLQEAISCHSRAALAAKLVYAAVVTLRCRPLNCRGESQARILELE